MNMDAELDRLSALYADKGDEELLRMDAQRDDLTDAAQEALAQVMRERGLQPSVSPGDGTGPTPRDGTEGANPATDEVTLCTFTDAFQANEAIRQLTNAGVACRIVDRSLAESADTRAMLMMGMLVDRGDAVKARAILQSAMGLFPSAEGDESAEAWSPLEDLTLLAMFEIADGLVAAQALGEAGISYLWRDGRDDTQELPDEHTVAIEVRADKLEQANRVVEEKVASASKTGQ